MSLLFLLALTLQAITAIRDVDVDNTSPWLKISHKVAFQRSADVRNEDKFKMDHATNEAIHRLLGSSQKSTNKTFGISPYDNGMLNSGTYWSSYQLAWRLLGYYVDCNQNESQDHKNRNLKKEDEGNNACTRYVMYAVYVDPDYEGGGIGEYTYYTLDTDEFQCYQGGTCRAKMDCHLPDTQWKMLGIFKISSLSEGDGWMEQLFKHEGVCVWGEDTYKFASEMRKNLPNQCKSSKVTDADGNYLYYAVKPEAQGNITIGLYIDYMCSKEYEGNDFDVWTLSGYSENYFEEFNRALDAYKICQPCVSYDLTEDGFNCYDEAGYTNCDQCMKFSAKAGCKIATMDDVKLAARQQGLLAFELYGATYGSGGIGRNATDPSDVAKAHFTTKLKVDQVTAMTEHALATSTGSYFEKFPYFFEVSIAFFLASLFVFIKALLADSRGQKEDKARPLLYSVSNAGTYLENFETSSSSECSYHCSVVSRCNKSSHNIFQQSSLSASFPSLQPLEDVQFAATAKTLSKAEFPKLLPLGANIIEAPPSYDKGDFQIVNDWESADSEIGGRGCTVHSADYAQKYIQAQGSVVDSDYAERYSLNNFSSLDDEKKASSYGNLLNSKTF